MRDEGTAARAAGRCPHAGAAWRGPSTEPGGPADLPGAALRERVTHLYNCQGLSTYQIAGIVGISRQRVGRMLRAAGVPVKPRGSGRRRRAARPDLDQLMADLYLQFGLSSIRIAELLGIPGRTVRERLRSLGVPMPSRGGFSREDRLSVPAEAIAALYVRSGLSAREVGEIFGVSHRIVLRAAHDMGLPVRVGGPPTRGGPEEIELVEALYADPAVQHTLQRHGAPRVPPGGTIWQRFPVALRVTPELAEELYVSCGLGLHHIELMTGQAAATIGRELVNSGIELRHAGGRSPFLRRWRTGAASRGQRA